MIPFTDLYMLDEDKRIEIIGQSTVDNKMSENHICFIVDDDQKADRYIKKLQAKFPSIRVLNRVRGPTPDSITVSLHAGAIN